MISLKEKNAMEFPATTTPTCRHAVDRSPRRTPVGSRTTTRGRFPGFRVTAAARLPAGLSASVAFWTTAIRSQLRGQPRRHTAFP